MADPRQRRERLLSKLPRIYTAQPSGSAVGAMIDSMAASLAQLDDSLIRTQHDRWVGLSSDVRPNDELPSALERLGQLLQVRRLPARIHYARLSPGADNTGLCLDFDARNPLEAALDELLGNSWRAADGSAPRVPPVEQLGGLFPGLQFVLGTTDSQLLVQANADAAPQDLARFRSVLEPEDGARFRQRLLITARVRSGGLTTPRALLALALADLGCDPCPRAERYADTTLLRGFAPGNRKGCTGCTGQGPCPRPEQAAVEAWITENPVLIARHQEPSPGLHRVFQVRNPSILPDRPVVRLQVSRQPAAYPALRSVDTGEILIYAGTLKPGETLILQPGLSPDETAPFNGYENSGQHGWLAAFPQGRATVLNAEGAERDVSGSVFYLWGNRLDDPGSTLDTLRYGVLEQKVLTPRLHRGDNNWMLLTFAQPQAEFAGNETQHTSRFADSKAKSGTCFALLDGDMGNGSGFSQALFESISKTDTQSAEEESDPNSPRFSLHLEWATRPPATFRLRIPKNSWVADAALRGALGPLRSNLIRASAAGVRALVDFPEPPLRDVQQSNEAFSLHTRQVWSEDHELADQALSIRSTLPQTEEHATGEGQFSMRAVFDTTRLNWSHAG
jgi:hypothetical protein